MPSDAQRRQRALDELHHRMAVILPEQYQAPAMTVSPAPMGSSAAIKYDASGHVLWNEMWQTFCDLAMAGGPPHKGALLEPGRQTNDPAEYERYERVAREICRGITLTTGMRATPRPTAGWVRVDCFSESMAEWLLRAITMENVAVRRHGHRLHLPAGSDFRLEKEIKNVVTVTAKTCHYWTGHVSRDRKQAIAELFAGLGEHLPLLEPGVVEDQTIPESHGTVAALAAGIIMRDTGLTSSAVQTAGWLAVECGHVHDAVALMRALVASNVLARREGTRLCVPINPETDPAGRRVSEALAVVHRLTNARTTPTVT